MQEYLLEVSLNRASRLLNHGPTVLVSARHDGVANVMAAAWACALDFDPPKLTVVLDRIARTRDLIEASGVFAIQLPTLAQVGLTQRLGTSSLHDTPGKLAQAGADLFAMSGHDLPLVSGCAAWMICRLIPEPRNQERYDLFIGEVVAAWADSRVFRDGRWRFEQADPMLRTIHHVAGGHYYAIGEAVDA